MRRLAFIVDGNNHLHADWHGAGDRAYETFRARLQSLKQRFRPQEMAIAMDAGPSFRKGIDPEYKAGRADKPQALQQLLRTAPDRLREDGWKVCSCQGFEAEDVIATLTADYRAKEYRVAIASTDKDVRQLLQRDGVTVLRKYSKQPDGTLEVAWYTQDDLYDEHGLTPEQWMEFLALAGDSGDNVKGAKGVGDKTAKELLRRHGSLEYIVRNPWKLAVSDKQRNAIIEFGKDLADRVALVRLRNDVPLGG